MTFATLDDKLLSIEQQHKMDQLPWKVREQIATQIAAATNSHIRTRFGDVDCGTLPKDLQEQGLIKIPELKLNAIQVRQVVDYLKQKPVFANHVPTYSDNVPRMLSDPSSRQFPFGSYRLSDVANAPHLIELAFHPKVLAIAESYLGCVPSLFSLHAWWSFPGFSSSGPQVVHRDIDDYKFFALFIFLTDVEGGKKGGEHDFILTSHRHDTLARTLGDDTELADEFFYPRLQPTSYDEISRYRRIFGNKVQSITGPAGSVFMADTYGLHRGVRPTESDRLVCWIRFGVSKNWAYRMAKEPAAQFDWKANRIPDNAYTRYVSRLVFT